MFSHSRHTPKLFILFAILLLNAGAVVGQTNAARPDRGVMPNSSYAISDIENISLQNGNLNLSIPLASLPPIAGGRLSWTVSARYNSKLWNVLRTQADYPNDLQWNPYVIDSPSLDGGWAIGGQYRMYFRNSNEDFSRLVYPSNSGLTPSELALLNNYSYWKVVLLTPDGAEHEFRPIDHSSYAGTQDFLRGYFDVIPNGTAMRYYSVDGTYMFASITNEFNWTVYMPDGTRIIQTADGIQRLQDTNGNKIKIFSDANGTHYQDEQTGREIRVTYDPAANGGQGQGRVWYPTVTGIQHYIEINFGTTTVQGKNYFVEDWMPQGGETGGFVCQRTAVLSTQLSVVREIVLPQTESGQPQRRFTFSYNSDTTENASNPVNWSCDSGLTTYSRTASRGWGEISRIVTPSGSIVDYSYELDSTHILLGPADDLSRQSITEKKITHDGTIDTWTYGISELTASVSSPDGNNVTETKYCSAGCATGKAGLVYRTTNPFTMTERHWINLTFSGANTASPGGNLNFNPVVDVEYTTLLDGSNNPLKMAAKAFQYDYNGNVTQVTEYDWFDPALVSRDTQGVPTGVPGSATVLRVTNNSHYNQATGSTSSNVYAKRSLPTVTPLILNAPKETTVGPGIVRLSYDGQAYGVAPTIGNLTTKEVWANLDAKWITTSNTYGLYGNLATATDARGKVTQFFYDDATHALPTRVVVDPQNGTGTQTTTTSYDYHTGLVTSQKDVNDQLSTISYTNHLLGAVDPFGRPGITFAPQINIDGTNHQRRVTTTYLDSARQVIVAADLNAENDQLLKTRTTIDQLGRPVLTEQTEDGTNYTISSVNKYLDMGRVTLTSSPRRSTASTTDSWTRVTKDNAGRVIEVATFGGAAQPAWSGTSGVFTGAVTTTYAANFTTVTDQVGKVRRSMVDALGRLQCVDEPDASGSLGSTTNPAQSTSYSYDVFGNLTTVTQGSQTRAFTYDSLSRLRTAVNPESGTISYQYDDNGNLIVKTDARSVSAHFAYDSLNRVTRRWYNGSNSVTATTHNSPALPSGVGATSEAKFYYDSQSLPTGAPFYTRGSAIGRLVAQTYGTGSNGDYFAYDVLGRATLKIQQTGAVNYQLSAAYKLSGAIGTLTYPSGHTVSHLFDQAGRLTSVSGNLGDGATRTYATGILYAPTGGLEKEQFGTTTPVYNKLFYNSRGQLAEIRASTSYTSPTDYDANRGAIINSYSSHCTGLCLGSSMPDNNGNLKQQDIQIPSVATRSQFYEYDSLNRLLSVREAMSGTDQWRQWFSYDRWGNRTIDTTINPPDGLNRTYGIGINNKAFTVITANNRLGVPAGQSGVMTYDTAGNLTNDTYTGAGNRTYDAENKITSAWGGNNQAQLYTYDASGQRIKRTVDTVETWQVYGLGGELLAEYPASGAPTSPQKEYGYRNGQLLVTSELGSTGGGGSAQNVVWTNAVGVSASGNNLTRTAAGDGWNAGAVSSQSIASGDGYAEFTASETNKTRSVGLTDNTSVTGFQHIDYGIVLGDNGQISIHEGLGVYGVFGTYTTGDTLRVAVEGGVVKYRKNGTLLRTSTVAPTYPLYAGAALYTNGSTVTNAVTSGSGSSNVVWTNAVGVSASGNNLTRTAAGDGWNAGAVSSQSIASGDGYAEFTASETNKARSVGLTDNTSVTGFQHIDYGIVLGDNGQISIHEGLGVYGVFGTYTTGDTLRVAVEGGVVKYRKNGTLLRTSTVAPTYPLYAGAALYTNGSTVTNAVLSSGGGSSPAVIYWLITDHLGTPRMILDQTGSLAGMKRHDYLPFGEELVAPTGGRSAAQGYAGGDGVRQQFTSKERDVETGLDYFGARYYASLHGRFTSADPFSIILLKQNSPGDKNMQSAYMQFLGDPRRWNRFAYSINSPLVFTDKTGLDIMIIENGATKGNPLGHTAIAVTGRGVFSMGNAERTDRSDRRDSKNNILRGGVADYLNRESPRRNTTIIIVKTTPEQDAKIVSSLNDQAATKRDISQDKKGLATDNCSLRVNEALDKAGGFPTVIDGPGASSPTLPGSAGGRAVMSGLPVTIIEMPQGTKVSDLNEAQKQAIDQFEPAPEFERSMKPPGDKPKP